MNRSDHWERGLLRRLFDTAIESADPRRVLAQHLPDPPRGRCVVIGAGKASALMARAVEEAWPDVRMTGVVSTRYGHGVETSRIEVLEAGHPVPDHNSLRAARLMLEAVKDLGPDDLVLALMSGGGSSLLVQPVEGITLQDKQEVNRLLLSCGADIGLMNTVRRRLSAVKGGRLARAAAPARLVTLAISDVPGDDPMAIASGPTYSAPGEELDLTTFLDGAGRFVPPHVRQALARPQEPAAVAAVPDFRLIATPAKMLTAVAEEARRHGLQALILGDALEGDAASLGTVMSGIARSVRHHGVPVAPSAVLLSGGETTVSIGSGPTGRGGRNTAFLLSLLAALKGEPGIWALAGDTDGIDGTEDAAGGTIGPDSWTRALSAGLNPAAKLAEHDSYSVFGMLDDLIITGPTRTNVNDFRAILIA